MNMAADQTHLCIAKYPVEKVKYVPSYEANIHVQGSN